MAARPEYLTEQTPASAGLVDGLFAYLDDLLAIHFSGKTPLFWTGTGGAAEYWNWVISPNGFGGQIGTLPGDIPVYGWGCPSTFGCPFFFINATPPHPYVGDGFHMNNDFYSKWYFGNLYEMQVASATPAAAQPYLSSGYFVAPSGTKMDWCLANRKRTFSGAGPLVPDGDYYMMGQVDSYMAVNGEAVYPIGCGSMPTTDNVRYWVDRVQTYGQAEMIVEGMTVLNIPDGFDKFNFFRVHNLSASALSVRDGTSRVLMTVPAFGCKCLRRLSTGVYEEGYRYFHRVHAGDPRLFYGRSSLPTCTPAGSHAANNVANVSLLYEWLLGPATKWSGLLRFNRWVLDEHEHWDAGACYKDHFAGLNADGTVKVDALLADVLFHKGWFHLINQTTGVATRHEYTGWASLAAAGITVGADGEGLPTIQKAGFDMACTGINLLVEKGWGKLAPVFSIDTPVTIGGNLAETPAFVINPGYAGANGQERTVRVETSAVALNAAYYDFTSSGGAAVLGEIQNQAKDEAHLVRATGGSAPPYRALKVQIDMVSDLLTLGHWGVHSDPDGAYSTFGDRSLVFTGQGPAVLCTERIGLGARLGAVGMWRDILPGSAVSATSGWYLDGDGNLARKVRQRFRGVGWPFLSPKGQWDLTPAGGAESTAGEWISYPVMDARIYYSQVVDHQWDVHPVSAPVQHHFAYHHPEVLGEFYTTAPKGVELGSISDYQEQPQARVLALAEAWSGGIYYQASYFGHPAQDIVREDTSIFAMWRNGDCLRELVAYGLDNPTWYLANRTRILANAFPVDYQGSFGEWTYSVRLPLRREAFNNMVELLRSVVKIMPLTLGDFAPVIGGARRTVPGTSTGGLYGTKIRPKNQYLGFTNGDAYHTQFTALGVTVRTAANLPAPFSNMMAAKVTKLVLQGELGIEVTGSSNTSFGGDWYYTHAVDVSMAWSLETEETSTSYLNNDAGDLQKTFGAGASYSDISTYRWVSVDDMKALAESLGVPFVWQAFGNALQLVEGVPASVDVLQATATPSTGTWYVREPNTAAYPRAGFPRANGTQKTMVLKKSAGNWGRFYRFCPAADLSESEWIESPSFVRVAPRGNERFLLHLYADAGPYGYGHPWSDNGIEMRHERQASYPDEWYQWGWFVSIDNTQIADYYNPGYVSLTPFELDLGSGYRFTEEALDLGPVQWVFEVTYSNNAKLRRGTTDKTISQQSYWGLPANTKASIGAVAISVATAEFSQDSLAVFIPSPWADWSADYGNTNFNYGVAVADLGPNVVPCTAEASIGAASLSSIGLAAYLQSPDAGARDLVVIWDAFVPVT